MMKKPGTRLALRKSAGKSAGHDRYKNKSKERIREVTDEMEFIKFALSDNTA